MTVTVVTPSDPTPLNPGPCIYLAGGAVDFNFWQDKAVKIMKSYDTDTDMNILVPDVTGNEHTSVESIRQHFAWQESYHRPGTVVMFWFPKETPLSPAPYMALFQLDWAVGHTTDISVGAEPGGPYTEHVASRARMYRYSQGLHDNLADTVAGAVRIIA